MKKTHDYVRYYRGYWSDGGKCRIRIYGDDGQAPVIICSQLPDNRNTSIANIVEYLAVEVIVKHSLSPSLTWVGNICCFPHPRSESPPVLVLGACLLLPLGRLSCSTVHQRTLMR
jgi:hypothetical protein